MSTEKPNTEPFTVGEWPTFETVYQSLVRLIRSTPEDRQFPANKLRNRLINIGLKEILEGDERGNGERALEVHGFPFKFISQWDEATLTLAHFLGRFREEENSKLEICALHRLSKGEDKTLSDWQSAKAKFYLELQNMILLLNGIGGRQSRIRRIFAFSKIADIAFLTQSAISLLSEQVAAGIGTGFLFVDTFEAEKNMLPISNGLLVNFRPNPEKESAHQFHFYTMYELLDEKKGHELPYQERCATKWFKDSDQAFQSHPWIKEVFNLFPRTDWEKPDNQWAKWQKPDYKAADSVYSLEGPEEASENQMFNSAVVMMARAFAEYGGASIDDFNNRINHTVVTSDWIRLQRAISAFDDPRSLEIRAVDATSVKNSLTIHESDPTYRHWLRTSLSRVLKSSDESPKSLKRIYILDDDKQKRFEFPTLLREMQYYLDYFNYEIAEMSSVTQPEGLKTDTPSNAKNGQSLNERWFKFKERISVYVTTTTILTDLASQTIDRDVLLEIVRSDSTPKSLRRVDFISSSGKEPDEGMIYNFLNQRADPGELKFDAFLFRKPFDIGSEERILFGYLNDLMGDLRTLQFQFRLKALAESIRDYEKEYGRIITAQLNSSYEQEIDDLKEKLAKGEDFDEAKLSKFIDIRRAFEIALYQHFERPFSYLYCFLKHYSLQVSFFDNFSDRKVEKIDPFVGCENAEMLTERIREALKTRGNPPTFEKVKEGWDCP